jgi:hypothetical protein
MAPGDSLVVTVEATQRALEERLGAALDSHRERPRDGYAATDAFMAATSRHMAAVEAVLLGEARHAVPEGEALVHDYLVAARRLELSLAWTKARLYGEAHAVHLGWLELWDTVRADLDDHNRLERRLVGDLVRHGDAGTLNGLARRLFDAETHAPTRPHPRLPHTGPLGGITHRIWAVADRFWDAAEGRVIPAPVKPPPHRHDSLLAQYLVADPRFDRQARLLEHRRRRR